MSEITAILVLASALAGLSPLHAAEPAPDRVKSLDDFIRREMHHLRIPGLGLAIVRGDADVFVRGYGLADLEAGTDVTAQTVFAIGSLTKQFTAAAVLLLVEDGKLELDDKVASHLENLPTVWADVTVRQLLSHTSGIRDYTEQPDPDGLRHRDNPPAKMLELVADAPLAFPPGKRFSYSNTNYLLLGLLIERVSGISYRAFLTNRIFEPLGLDQTRVNNTADVVVQRARGYIRVPGQTVNAPCYNPVNAFGAGDLLSSLDDLMKWDRALTAGKLLRPASYAAMWTPSDASVAGNDPYGFGWHIHNENGHRLFSHAGNITGFSCAILRYPDDHVTFVVLTNLGNFNAENLALGIARQVEPTFVAPLPAPIADPDPKIARRLRRVFLGMIAGDMNPEDFSDNLNRELGPLVQRGQAEAAKRAAENGKLESFVLLERKQTLESTELTYRADFEYQMRAKLFVSLDDSGKIINWGIRSAD